MKKLLISIIIIITGISLHGQYGIYTGGFNFNSMTGSDTAFYHSVFPNRNTVLNGPWSVTVNDELIVSDSLYCTVGFTPTAGDFKELSITNWPYELNTSTNTMNGSLTHGRSAYDDVNPYRYLVVKFYKDTTGTYPVAVTANDSVNYKVMMFEK